MLSQKRILSVTHILKKIPDIACAYLHGSALTNHFSILSSYHTVFSKEVVTKGRLIICTDSNFCKTFVIKKGFHDFIRFCDSMGVKISSI